MSIAGSLSVAMAAGVTAGGADIVNFNYGDGRGWPPQADGAGHSIVLLDSALGAQGSGDAGACQQTHQESHQDPEPGVAVLLIDTDRKTGDINEEVYGHFLEHINLLNRLAGP